MSKAISSLFCVAVLFSSGLVLAKPGTGGAIKGIDKAGDLANNAIEGLADSLDPNSLEAQGIGLGGDILDSLIDTLGDLAGGAINAGEKAGDLANAGYDAAIAGINRGTQAINNSGNQGAQANTNPQFDANSLEDQVLDTAGDILDNLINLGENAKVLKRLTQAINN